MNKLSKVLLVSCAQFVLACAETCIGSTYSLVPQEGIEAPWGIRGGSITTDGTLGDITALNFVSWSVDLSSPAGFSSLSSDTGHAVLIEYVFTRSSKPPVSPSFTATKEHLVLNPSRDGVIQLVFSTQSVFDDDFLGKLISFSPAYESNGTWERPKGGGFLIDNTVDMSQPIGADEIEMQNPNQSFFRSPAGPLVVATSVKVPEPRQLIPTIALFLGVWTWRVLIRR